MNILELTYDDAVQMLLSLPDMERKQTSGNTPSMSLQTIRKLLQMLDNPQEGRHTIHVTGSKGKGSTCAMIANILQECKLHTALFTSPHLHSYCERIAFGSKPISEKNFARTAQYLLQFLLNKDVTEPLSTFGLLTIMFFLSVRDANPHVDWQVVEVGLGGRDDATNVFDKKDLVIITPISLEHTDVLGKTCVAIARHKIDIITPRTTVILAPQNDLAVINLVEQKCAQMRAKLINVERNYHCNLVEYNCVNKVTNNQSTSKPNVFTISGPNRSFEIESPMLGLHQMRNAATAVAAAEALTELGYSISPRQIVNGIKRAQLPGRFEIINDDKGKQTIILDAAHNQDSACALVSTLTSNFSDREIIFIIGINKDKDIFAFLQELSKVAKQVIATCSTNERSANPKYIAELAKQVSPNISTVVTNSVSQAMQQALSLNHTECAICVTGSFYTVAEARKYLSLS